MSVLADFALPFLRCLDPEKAHDMTLAALKMGLGPKAFADADGRLVSKVWDMYFPNPVGLAAGFDKNAEVADAMLDTGLGFVEVGSVTPKPQAGNPKPRIFRLPKDGGIINRLGFNNKGMDVVAGNLARRHHRRHGRGIVGVNLGRNKTSEDAVADYACAVEKLAPFADYLVINVSSPNTPGLRGLQDKTRLANLVTAVLDAGNKALAEKSKPPLLVKIAPDLSRKELAHITSLALDMGIDGLIIANTTTSRPDFLRHRKTAQQTGGLSGKPLMALSTELLAEAYELSAGKIPLIGAGGVASGQDAYGKIRAGASLVQLYSALVYQGPALIPRIKRELSECLAKDGFENIMQAVGADHR